MTDEQILALAKGSDTVDFYIHNTTKEQAESFARQIGEPVKDYGIRDWANDCGRHTPYYTAENGKYRAIAFFEEEVES